MFQMRVLKEKCRSKLLFLCPKSITSWQIAVYLFVLSFCFFFFQHMDLSHTVLSANAYLAGHFTDFYNYNKVIVERNDYLPILYIVIAIWNLPLKLLDLVVAILNPDATPLIVLNHYPLNAVQIYWTKMLIVLCFFGTTFVLYKIAHMIANGDRERSRVTATIFATAPIAVFVVFIFGQYDIVGVFVTLIGYYYYLQRKMLKFVVALSFAISFKYVPVLVFFPLLLLVEKRIWHLLIYTLMASAVALLQIAIYWSNAPFREHTVFSLVGSKLTTLSELQISQYDHMPYLILFYIIICLYAYIKEPIDAAALQKQSVFIAAAVFSAVYSTVLWHPQWLIWITPFFALTTLYMYNKEKFYLIELIGMLSYVMLVVNFYPNNVDVQIFQWSPLGHFFPAPCSYNARLIHYFPLAMALFNIYLFSPLLILAFQQSNSSFSNQVRSGVGYFNARFLLGIGVFVIPSLLCIWPPKHLPKNIALKLFPSECYIQSLKVTQIGELQQRPVGEVVAGGDIVQSFRAKRDNLTFISIMMATYLRVNNSKVTFSLMDENHKKIIDDEIEASTLSDNKYYHFNIPTIKNSKGKKYYLKISSVDAKSGNAVTAWCSAENKYPEEKLFYNNVAVQGSLVMRLYYDISD